MSEYLRHDGTHLSLHYLVFGALPFAVVAFLQHFWGFGLFYASYAVAFGH